MVSYLFCSFFCFPALKISIRCSLQFPCVVTEQTVHSRETPFVCVLKCLKCVSEWLPSDSPEKHGPQKWVFGGRILDNHHCRLAMEAITHHALHTFRFLLDNSTPMLTQDCCVARGAAMETEMGTAALVSSAELQGFEFVCYCHPEDMLRWSLYSGDYVVLRGAWEGKPCGEKRALRVEYGCLQSQGILK